ncbi:LysR substrate-binding domain-containing protein [Rhizobium rhizogenes]|uniref:LysR substrate-binding domain-containing protein n=1 Tax=Rhizobium rhizogenes TaxID=359 RepID=UPI00068D37F0|nr:LysR substrate-binding domain-containing protein [Rhizobium rhizogenes]MQB35015.1 LysR family transcriptional regulator [Rhizobium rhizogenes]NTF70700.1 LysR family transcriptional regulator [Rhizobium rhizogenes]NTI82600.1 LysR family transcriptional regulator [Rhizobium rhizogenes]NTJ24782.1 LysR family transcriptional regulator [Rhizobium rhizogenes]QUE83952.1 LysR family transcriptional regulator [Rhizobium rhizogenes]
MEHLGTLNAFVHAADTGSFVAAGRNTGLSASAVGKAITRLEKRLGVRLFHRNTRNMVLTEEGRVFLERCRRIFGEIEAAEMEMTQIASEPSGRLRVSLPLVGMLLTPVIAEFMEAYPAILLDLDYSDRIVDVVEEGFDVVIRTGAATDSRLMRRSLGRFRGRVVASPNYLARCGRPEVPEDLTSHACLRQRSPASGKLVDWPLAVANSVHLVLPETMSATTIEPLIHLAERGFGIAFLPPFAVSAQIDGGTLVALMEDYIRETGEFAALWPTSRQLSPRIRAFVNFLAENVKFDVRSVMTADSADG